MLKDKIAVITGGSRGIGKAIALEMAKNGAHIAVIYSGNKEAAQNVCQRALAFGSQARSYQCDVSSHDQAKRVCDLIVAEFGAVDILVNNAGIVKDALLLRMSEQDFDSVVAVNLKGAFNFTKHLARAIMKSTAGRIINISSVSGLMGNPGQVNYASAKAGLIGFTKTVAKELAARQVTCNAIAPGFIETDMTADLSASTKSHLDSAIPLKRVGQPEDIANLAVFLASDRSSYITGAVISVDGGMNI